MKKVGLAMGVLALVSLLFFTISCVGKDFQVIETYTDTEYKTEYRTESYTATEDVVTDVSGEDAFTPKLQWFDDSLPRGTIVKISGSFLYLGYEITDYETSKVTVTFYTPVDCFIDAYDVSQIGQINKCPVPQGGRGIAKRPEYSQWVTKVNSQFEDAKHLFYMKGYAGHTSSFTFDTTGIKELAMIISSYSATGGSIEQWVELNSKLAWTDKVTETKTVTKERQVPYQVPYQVEKQRTVTQTKKVPFWALFFGD